MTRRHEVHIESTQGLRSLHLDVSQQPVLLTELLRRHSLPLNTRCGQRGLCDGCEVELTGGGLVHLGTGARVTSNGQAVTLRGCEHVIDTNAGVTHLRIPPRSLLAHTPQVLSDFAVNVPWANQPLDAHDPRPLGIAIDIGTTTVVVLVVERSTGKVLAKASDFNQQMHLGDDVLTRINLCSTDPTMLSAMQKAIVAQTLAPLIARALDETDQTAGDVAAIVMAGNTTMLHLVAGVDPSPIGIAPFTPRFLDHQLLTCAKIGLELPVAPNGKAAAETMVHLLPSAAGYIGADLVAGVFASGLVYDAGPSLLVDIGTNGEIIARYDHRLIGCATAAGPAFEGSRLKCGMRATVGAIDHVTLQADPPDVKAHVIGGARRAAGLCGSAYIDLLAHLRRCGLLTATGRFAPDMSEGWSERITQRRRGRAFRVARGHDARDVIITETDIVSLLQAKAAIAAGLQTLMRRLGVDAPQVRTLYLAGGFGMHLDIPCAIAAGLLPGLTPQQVRLVGNTSLAGAYLTLLDRGVLDEMTRIQRKLEVIELNLDPEFESCYIDNLSLP